MSKRTMHCGCGSYCKAMVIKRAKLTSEAARKYSISRGRHSKVETTETGMFQFCAKTVVCVD
jgi:hypothetical protein